MNTATQLGLDAVNKARQAVIEQEASLLIQAILSNQYRIKAHEETIKTSKDALSKIASTTITQQSVLGAELQPPFNANQATIIKVIDDLNKAEARRIEATSQGWINNITATQKNIDDLNKVIGEAKEKLAKLQVSVVTAEAVV